MKIADRARHPFPTGMVAAAVTLLAAGLAFQLVVYGDGGHTALSDLPRVFLHRGVGPGSLPYVDRVIEYPVAAGGLLYLAALVSATPLGVLLVTAFASSVLCVAITVVLERSFGSRAWRWAVGVPIFLYAFQNWDIFAIAALLAGVFAFEAGHDRAAGAALGLGAAIKLFPAVVVPPLIAIRLTRGDRKGAARLAASSAAVFAVINLPVLLANPSGWWWPFTFQGSRNATWGSAWFWFLRDVGAPVHGPGGAHLANVVSFVALVAALGWLTFATTRRRLSPYAAAAAAVVIFVLCNKVYSPTYDVWILAFFVLLPIRRRLWVAFCAVDLAVYATVFGYFHADVSGVFVRGVLPFLVAARTVVLIAVVVAVTRRRGVESPPPSEPVQVRTFERV